MKRNKYVTIKIKRNLICNRKTRSHVIYLIVFNLSVHALYVVNEREISNRAINDSNMCIYI